MKLELKHLAPYLPYGLKGVCTEENQGIETVIGILSSPSYVEVRTNVDDCDITLFKPILRPLSDITKDCKYDGMQLLPFGELEIYQGIGFDYLIEQVKTGLVEVIIWNKLIEHHYDVFGLIDKNLAISIHDIKQ